MCLSECVNVQVCKCEDGECRSRCKARVMWVYARVYEEGVHGCVKVYIHAWEYV